MGDTGDAIGPLTSQVNGPGGSNVFLKEPAVHSPGAVALEFGGPHEYQQETGIPAKVIELLNTPITTSSFSLLPPLPP